MSVKRAGGMGCRGRCSRIGCDGRLELYGADGVHPKRGAGPQRGWLPAVPVQTERRVIALALAWPTCGLRRDSDQLAREGVAIARDHGLAIAAPATTLHPSGAAGGPGTRECGDDGPAHRADREARAARGGGLTRATCCRSIPSTWGKLKGVGQVWQITGCDVASSFAWARLVIGEVTAAAVLAFLEEVVCPGYRHAGWDLQRVLTDNGKEFKGVFAAGCAHLGIRLTRTKPRHAWTNGFVERLQKTIPARAGASPFAGNTSRPGGPCSGHWIAFCGSTTSSGPTAGIA